MLRSLFIPTAIKNYYYVEQRIVSIEINKQILSATIVKAQGKKRTIEQCLERVIPTDDTLSYQENVAVALQALFAEIGRYDSVTLVLPSNQVVFKEITIPFTDPEKVKLVVPFEVESLLPYGLHEATIDSIIVHTDKETHQSNVLVAAVKNDYLNECIAPFTILNISLSRITIDIFELFDLYLTLPSYAQNTTPVAFISLNFNSTYVTIIDDHKLKFIRVLTYGINKLAKDLEPLLKIGHQELIDKLMNFGIDSETEQVHAKVAHFFEDLLFSLQLSTTKLGTSQLSKIIITGPGADIKGVEKFLTDTTHIPAEQFQTHTLVHDGLIKIKNGTRIPQIATASLAGALSSTVTEEFNLITGMTPTEESLLKKQVIVACILFVLCISIFGIYSFFTIRSLRNEVQESEQEAINKLKKEFTLAKSRDRSLEDVNNRARQELPKEEAIWFALQNKSFLHYLQELSTRIDREGLGLGLKKLTLNEDGITIEGQVKDFEALKVFEEDLQQSNLFTVIPKLHDVKFSVELPLDKNYKER